jgi:adenosylcobinamide-phosphate synthase
LIALAVIVALFLDRLLGEPKHLHPLAGFGHVAKFIERLLLVSGGSGILQWASGLLALLLMLSPVALWLWLDWQQGLISEKVEWGLGVLVLYLCLGGRSLVAHARAVRNALRLRQLDEARKRTGYLVSRETKDMSEVDMSKATVESVLENGCDAIFGALFWFVVAGLPGVLAYRLVNTLDAMWGYRTERYRYFGWGAARLDDVLNFIPARLTAFTYANLGNYKLAMRCWRTQAKQWESPNAGPVMAAGAGALSIELGGPARYFGELHERPVLGEGALPTRVDIDRAIFLLQRGVWLWIFAVLVGWGLYFLLGDYIHA